MRRAAVVPATPDPAELPPSADSTTPEEVGEIEAPETPEAVPVHVRVKSVPRQWDVRRRGRWEFPQNRWTYLEVRLPEEDETLDEGHATPEEVAELRADHQLIVEATY